MYVLPWIAPTGGTYWAFPVTKSLADWDDFAVELIENEAPDTGRYTGTVNPANGLVYAVFAGATQPASWDLYLQAIAAELLSSAAIAAELAPALIAAGGVTIQTPVNPEGQIDTPIVIGDDYLASHGRAFLWTVAALPDVAVGDASCYFGIKNADDDGFVVAGTVTEGEEEDTWDLTFDLARSATEELPEGDYKWSVEVRDAADKEVTRVMNKDFNYRVRLVAKQTNETE